MLSKPEILLQVAEVRQLTRRVVAYRLISPDGESLPAWSAGAHLNFRLPSGRARCYSLCGDPAQRSDYWVAIQREDAGQGGSLEVAKTFARGVLIRTDLPRNGFPLAQNARRHILLAGGIGITPIIAMIHQLQWAGADYFVHVCARSMEETAFREIVLEEVAAGRAALHHDANDPSRRPNIKQLVGDASDGTHAYACGPHGFLAAFREATAGWPDSSVHVESFAPDARIAESDRAFEIEIASSGEILKVPAGKTIHSVLTAHGHAVDTSCRQGICGSCMVRYLEGEPDHRDGALTEEERREFLTVCCSRAQSTRLVLDL